MRKNSFVSEGTICYKYTPEKAKNITIYAWCNEATKDVSVDVPVVCFPFCVDKFRMPGLNSEGNDIAEDLTYGTGVNTTKKVYPEADVESFKSNYINRKEFGLTALSNRNSNYNKAFYTFQEAYNIDYDIKWYEFLLVELPGTAVNWLASKLMDLPEDISAGALVKFFNEKYSDDDLFNLFEEIVTKYMAKDELKENIIAMIHKFKRNEGGVYKSELLTKNIENHTSTSTYCEELQDYIAEKLKTSNGKISDLIEKEIDWATDEAYRNRREKGKTTTRVNEGKEIFFLRPQFNSISDLRQGQRIALNDIWSTDINITEYKIEGDEYTIKYDVTLWDHFGLDSPDLQKWFNLIGKARAVFAAWFTLQHLRGYKPFITKMQFSKEFSGILSEGKYERVKNRKNESLRFEIETATNPLYKSPGKI